MSKISGLYRRNAELNQITTESITEALLILMIDYKYEEISVSAICEKAGVSRNAFYKNFGTKDNVFKSVVTTFNKQLLKKVGNPFNKRVHVGWYVNFFELVKENYKLYELVINSGFQNTYLEYVNKLLTNSSNLDAKTKYNRLLWNGAIQNTVIDWIKHGMKETPTEMAKICYPKLKVFKIK